MLSSPSTWWKIIQFSQIRNASFLRNGTASLYQTIYTHLSSNLKKKSNFCIISFCFVFFLHNFNQVINYGGKCQTRLLKHCNKDEMTQRSGNIIQYLSANFAGMVDDKWPQRSNTLNPAVCWGCLCKRQRYPLLHPQNSLIMTLQEKPFNNINQSLKKRKKRTKCTVLLPSKDIYEM